MNSNDYRLRSYAKAGGKDIDGDKKEKGFNLQAQRDKEELSSITGMASDAGTKNSGDKTPKEASSEFRAAGFRSEDFRRAEDKMKGASLGWDGKVKTVNPSHDAESKKAADLLKSGGLIMVPKKEGQKESIYRRVAKFLILIGVDEAARIMPHLTEEQTEKIIPEIATIQSISSEEATKIFEEFQSLVDKSRESGGLDTAKTILTKAYGSEKAQAMIDKAVPFAQGKPFEYLQDIDSERIRLLLSEESEAVKALVLSQLEPKKAASIINELKSDEKSAVVLRLAKMKPVSPEVMSKIDKSLHDKLLAQNTGNSQNLDGRNVLSQILKRMDPDSEQSIINNLSSTDPELGQDLRKRLFTEEDVRNSDNRYIQKVLHDMSNEEIAILIRGKPADFRTKILTNVSKGRGDDILEEESLKEFVLKADSEKVTNAFFTTLRKAWEKGDLIVYGRDDGEIYV